MLLNYHAEQINNIRIVYKTAFTPPNGRFWLVFSLKFELFPLVRVRAQILCRFSYAIGLDVKSCFYTKNQIQATE